VRLKSKRKPAKKALPLAEVKTGAARALERLEAEEAVLYSAYKTAKATGDILTAKLSRDSSLKVGESLRKYDLMVATARRGEGELVPRAQVEAWLAHLSGWIHFGLIAATGTADKAFRTMALSIKGFVGGDPKRHDHSAPVPVWMQRALFSEGLWADPDKVLLAWRRGYYAQEAALVYSDDPVKFAKHIEDNIRLDLEALKGREMSLP